jgi:hypothetical protein
MNLTQKISIVFMDLLLIIELCISMHLATQNPDAFTLVFVRSFLMMCIPTLILTKVLVSRLRSKGVEAESSDAGGVEAQV